jgi:hypothetical protein
VIRIRDIGILIKVPVLLEISGPAKFIRNSAKTISIFQLRRGPLVSIPIGQSFILHMKFASGILLNLFLRGNLHGFQIFLVGTEHPHNGCDPLRKVITRESVDHGHGGEG